ncbi:hypothetical protein EST38_g8044, partial [Candolleomyces aberdarensis]
CFLKMVDTLNTFAPNAESRPFDTIQSLTLDFTVLWEEPTLPSESAFHSIPTSITSLELSLPAHNDAFGSSYTQSAPLHLPPQLLRKLTSFSICCDWNGGLQFMTALPHCVNVENLTIDLNDNVGWWYNYDPFIQRFRTGGLLLPKLRTLSLKRASPASDGIIELLKTPSLEALNIHFSASYDHLEDYDFAPVLHKFLNNRSQCAATFRSLRLECLGLTGIDFQTLLLGLPTITHLVLDQVDIWFSDHEVLFHLTAKDQKILPNLESLKIMGLTPEWAEDSTRLAEFLSARRNYIYANVEKDSVIFVEPPDSLKELVLNFRRTKRFESHDLDNDTLVKSFRQDCRVLFNIGALLFQ